jgi:hypothetical protein
MVAIADENLRRSYASALKNAGWQVQQAHEGRETLQIMAQDVPDVAIIDGGFAPIFGMGLGEIIKKSNITRSVRVLGLRADEDTLLPLPGAERTISLTAGAVAVLEEVNRLLPSNGTPPAALKSQTGFVSRPQTAPQTTPIETVPEASSSLADSPEHQSAKRLARIILSDISMYNQAVLEDAARAGTLKAAIEPFLAEGLEHYAARVPESVRMDTHYFEEAVAAYVARKTEALRTTTV